MRKKRSKGRIAESTAIRKLRRKQARVPLFKRKLWARADAAAKEATREIMREVKAVEFSYTSLAAVERDLFKYLQIYARAYAENRYPTRGKGSEYESIGELSAAMTRNLGGLLDWKGDEKRLVEQRIKALYDGIRKHEHALAETLFISWSRQQNRKPSA